MTLLVEEESLGYLRIPCLKNSFGILVMNSTLGLGIQVCIFVGEPPGLGFVPVVHHSRSLFLIYLF